VRRLLFFRAPWTALALGTSLSIRTTRTTGSARSARSARSTTTCRSSRSEFFLRELAVTVFVELQQGGRGILYFVGIQNAVMILIEGLHQWGDRPRPSIRTARTARTAGRPGALLVLGDGGEGCASQSQRQ